MNRKSGGGLCGRQEARIHRQLNRRSARIYRAKH
jgi:hypothetical protein